MATLTKQPSTQAINRHLADYMGSCYVDGPGYRFRIGRIRTRDGIREGRFIIGIRPQNVRVHTSETGIDWVEIPADAEIELH